MGLYMMTAEIVRIKVVLCGCFTSLWNRESVHGVHVVLFRGSYAVGAI